jgi:hypothetical protein
MMGMKRIVAGMDSSGKWIELIVINIWTARFDFSDRKTIVGWCIGKVSMLYSQADDRQGFETVIMT